VLSTGFIIGASLAYLGLLFGIAHWADRRAEAGRSVVGNAYVYALSLAVYATSWTFYGSVGRAAGTGIGFLPIYLGPTLMAALWWVVLRKMIRISRRNRITSLADFVSARYGKSARLGALVTVMAVVGIVPYISLQLKAISNTFDILQAYPEIPEAAGQASPPLLSDTALYVALLLAVFTILFGTRKLDASERHEGLVAAIAFESLVKLVAFVAVGAFVTFGLFGGFGDLFGRAAAEPAIERLFTMQGNVAPGDWAWLIVLSMLAILLLPRQFQVAVVENVDERHVAKAMWLFPLYLLAINVFVLPIAFGGLLHFGSGQVNADTFVLALPMAEGQEALALLAFVGGLSAATGMVIVEAIALSTMVSNSLVVPVLLGRERRGAAPADLGRLIIAVRRVAIVLILLLGYAYFRAAGETIALVSLGLVSFAGVAQFAPAVLGGMFWRGGTRTGALAGLTGGFAVWAYALLLPQFVGSGWLPSGLLEDGPFGIAALRPTSLLGLEGMDEVSHGMLWSMLVNLGLYAGVSLTGRQSAAERGQAALFVDALRHAPEGRAGALPRGRAAVGDLEALLRRFLGEAGARQALEDYGQRRGLPRAPLGEATADLVHHVETLLAGAVGSASARVLVDSVVEEEPLRLDDVMEILDEASQIRTYSRELERKSRELEAATAELRAANERLQELDELKDEFVSTVSHELRTPLTSIRALAEILLDNPDVEAAQREHFLRTIVHEAERLTRLINQVLDLAKLESGRAEWRVERVSLPDLIVEAVTATEHLVRDRAVTIDADLPDSVPAVLADRDRVMQVLLNLLSNAAKFCDPRDGRIRVRVRADPGEVQVDVADNGGGIAQEEQALVFQKFRQAGESPPDGARGTGLGLPISREIVTRLGGRIWVRSAPGDGATFSFALPVAGAGAGARRARAVVGEGAGDEDPDR
jgi:Na+/proline symporter/nitrogen-specific signal transduction histidine kinase